MVDRDLFPHLDTYQETSPDTPAYNCVAWAAEDTQNFWWPRPEQLYYWPPDIPREATLARFLEAFRTLGYEPCDNGDLEDGWQKVVIYTDTFAVPTHMARQLDTGMWTSKLGNDIDISHHRVEDLEGPAYGSTAQYLSRAKP